MKEWIKDKSIHPKPNTFAVIAVRVDEESVDYHTAIFCNDNDAGFILATDDIGQFHKMDEIEAYLPFEKLD